MLIFHGIRTFFILPCIKPVQSEMRALILSTPTTCQCLHFGSFVSVAITKQLTHFLNWHKLKECYLQWGYTVYYVQVVHIYSCCRSRITSQFSFSCHNNLQLTHIMNSKCSLSISYISISHLEHGSSVVGNKSYRK